MSIKPQGNRVWFPWVVGGLTLLLVVAGLFSFFRPGSVDHSKVYRIGYGEDIPFHFTGANGKPTGLAVELVREAASRRKIQLEWKSVKGFGSNQIDLWVLMTVVEERKKKTHFTHPYLQTGSLLVVQENSPVHELGALRNPRISTIPYGIHRIKLSQLISEYREVAAASTRDALFKLAAGEVDAAFLDEYAALAAMMSGGFGVAFRVLPTPALVSRMGVASTFDCAAVADDLREGMRSMVADGTMSATVMRWGLFPSLTSDMIAEAVDANLKARWLAYGMGALVIILVCTLWVAVHLKRQASDLKLAQKALIESEERLRQSQKMEAVGRLSGGIAHDFNNLLSIMGGNVSLLEMDENLYPEQRECLKEIEASVERGAELVRRLLAFSRRQMIRPKNLDLNQVIEGMLKLLHRLLGENILVKVSCLGQPAMVHADQSMIEQVILNLAINAKDAMPKGGELSIQVLTGQLSGEALLRQPEAQHGSFVILRVTDSGCGISPESLPHIFEPFFTTKDVGKGTGLGLAMAYGIARQHGGWVEVSSEQGKGSTFQMYLPLIEGKVEKASASTDPAEAPRGTETVLLVEDEVALRKTVQKYLTQLGYRVMDAPTGPDALRVYGEFSGKIHLLITDMIMPDKMTGRDLAQKLRQCDPELKILIMSGYVPEAIGFDPTEMAGVEFLAKPFGTAALALIVRQCLDRVHV